MAKVKMYFDHLDDYELPDVCLQCGAPAEGRKKKLYSWYHPAINLLILGGLPCWILLAVLSNVLAKRRRVDRPLCPGHINQWPWRTLTILGGFVVFCIVGLLAFFVMAQANPGRANPLAGFLCIATFGVLVVWLVVAVVIQSTAIQPTVITDESITLKNVSKEFALAYKDDLERVDSRWDEEVRRPSRDGSRNRRRRPSRPSSEAIEPE